jgi:hypothetical protein
MPQKPHGSGKGSVILGYIKNAKVSILAKLLAKFEVVKVFMLVLYYKRTWHFGHNFPKNLSIKQNIF